MAAPSSGTLIQPALLTTLPRLAAPLLPGARWRGTPHDADGAPLLYLTFDDGPDPVQTPALLDCLAAHEASATFFLLGARAEARPGLVESILSAGHHVGSHGWTHADPWRSPRATVLDGFGRTEGLLEDLTGNAVRNVRPPYGHVTPALYQWSRTAERRLVLWDLMPGDFVASARPEAVADRIVRRARPGSIVVLHEGPVVTAAALDLALPALRRRGWRFASL